VIKLINIYNYMHNCQDDTYHDIKVEIEIDVHSVVKNAVKNKFVDVTEYNTNK